MNGMNVYLLWIWDGAGSRYIHMTLAHWIAGIAMEFWERLRMIGLAICAERFVALPGGNVGNGADACFL